ncbi:unnamed protein product [Ceutorhynchus assimilis]|uniref:Semaphorin-1A n=1 Tax=Ceutorhynchus assimilis TaxID=467358 RepID=A0A9P0DBE4_9CUCU|nr:unnamed protein product [Ceutorhynchus assimilis]
MHPSAFLSLKFHHSFSLFLIVYIAHICQAWLPDTSTKFNSANKISSISFTGNSSNNDDHFIILYQDQETLLLGGRNRIYNLSIFDFTERKKSEIFWPSLEAHGQLCILKGKSEEECQNYIRVMFNTSPGKLLVCGTNSFKPLCRNYVYKNGNYLVEKESEGIGVCPYDPEHNSTAIYTNGHLFTATVADFSGGDPLIYREPLRTELSDLKHLNAPNFVSSVTYGDYIYFFFRETAVEFMNCGKVIYSRVARVCKHDKGGPHQSRSKWTSFSKARLNCSVPGEYPFYFDEIQATSTIIEGIYNEKTSKIIYGALTTPDNAIGGSAICAFQMNDIQEVFKGPFKHQESINANWLPIPDNKIPDPRPGECVRDSRILPDANVNFIKTHPLMEKAVPSYHGRPILIRVSLNYRFTAIAVDPQVRTVNGKTLPYDVIYIGTDDGKILKVVNLATEQSSKAFVISDNEVFPKGTAVKQITLAVGYGRVVAVSKGEIKLVTINHCKFMATCSECIELRDPHCAWDQLRNLCVSVDAVTSFRYLVQDVARGDNSKCKVSTNEKEPKKEIDDTITSNSIDEEPSSSVKELSLQIENRHSEPDDCSNDINADVRTGCNQIRKNEFTTGTLWWGIIVAAMIGMFVGFVGGYCVSRKFYMQYPNTPFIEQRNHLDRLNVNQNSFLARPKNVNLDVLNVSSDPLPPKKDNLGSLKNLNITNEGIKRLTNVGSQLEDI